MSLGIVVGDGYCCQLHQFVETHHSRRVRIEFLNHPTWIADASAGGVGQTMGQDRCQRSEETFDVRSFVGPIGRPGMGTVSDNR